MTKLTSLDEYLVTDWVSSPPQLPNLHHLTVMQDPVDTD